MALSNYPPGVTGREFEIAGYDTEVEQEVECGESRVTLVVVAPAAFQELLRVQQLVEVAVTEHLPSLPVATLALWHSKLSQVVVTGIDMDVCPFEGEVLVGWFNGVGTWQCPACGSEHEIDGDV